MAALGTRISMARRAPGAAGLGQQGLAHDPFQHQRELGADLRLLVGREHVDDAVDGLGRGVGVQGAEGQVARLRDAQRRLDRLQVAHLADEHDVGVLAQGGAQRVGEGVGVRVQLALVDHALLVRVQVLDRVLDRDHVLVALVVDLVEHRRERRRLAGAGGPGHQHQAARLVADGGDHRGQAQLLEVADLVGDRAVDGGHRAALHEDVGAEARQALDAEAEVELEVLLEAVLLRVGQHAVGELLGLDRGQRRQVQRPQLAVDADLGRRVGGDVEVGAHPSPSSSSAAGAG